MKKEHMAFITDGVYDELDISNACYNITRSLAKQYKVGHTFVGYYCKHRDEVLNHLVKSGVSRADAKAYLISFLYGRKTYGPPPGYREAGVAIKILDDVRMPSANPLQDSITPTYEVVTMGLGRYLHTLFCEIANIRKMVTLSYTPRKNADIAPPQPVKLSMLTNLTPSAATDLINSRFTSILFYHEAETLRNAEAFLSKEIRSYSEELTLPRDPTRTAHACVKKFDALLIRTDAISPTIKGAVVTKLNAHILKHCNMDITFKLTLSKDLLTTIPINKVYTMTPEDFTQYRSVAGYKDHFDMLSHIYEGMELIAIKTSYAGDIPVYNMSSWVLGQLVRDSPTQSMMTPSSSSPQLREVIAKTGQVIRLEPHKVGLWFNSPICLTSHRAQGQTISVPLAIHEFHRMDKFGRYVSLTRTTNKHLLSFHTIDLKRLGI